MLVDARVCLRSRPRLVYTRRTKGVKEEGGLIRGCQGVWPKPVCRSRCPIIVVYGIMVWVKGRQDEPRRRGGGKRGRRSEERTYRSRQQRRRDRAVSDARFLLRTRKPIERNFRWLGLLLVWQSFSFSIAILPTDDF